MIVTTHLRIIKLENKIMTICYKVRLLKLQIFMPEMQLKFLVDNRKVSVIHKKGRTQLTKEISTSNDTNKNI